MNHNLKRTFFLVPILAVVATAGYAATATDNQTVTLNINEVAELTAGANITMTIVGTGTPGTQPANPTDSTSHLQYTSIVDSPLSEARKIQVKLAAANVPAGTSLKLTASSLAAGEGTAATQVTLTTLDQDLITAIESVATGALATNGPTLDYVWSIDTMTSLDFGSDAVVTVTFTLTAEA